MEARLKSINSFAPIMRCSQSNVSVDSVLNICAFDLKRTLEMDAEFLNTEGEHEHDNTVSSLAITEDGEVDLDLVQDWVSKILQEKGADIYRMKGVLAIANVCASDLPARRVSVFPARVSVCPALLRGALTRHRALSAREDYVVDDEAAFSWLCRRTKNLSTRPCT